MPTIYGGSTNETLQSIAGNDRIYGGDGSDLLYTSTTGFIDAFGGYGNDWIHAYNSNGNRSFMYGGEDNDVLQSGINSGADYMEGGQGNDAIGGGGGNDIIYGGDGDDSTLIGVTAGNITAGGAFQIVGLAGLYGDAGNDFVDGGRGNDVVYGGADIDTLYGGEGNDYVYGDAGDDLIFGGLGIDYLFGGDGVDTIYADGDQDNAYGGIGNDKIYGTAGTYNAYGEAGDDVIGGSGFNDTLYGGADGDLLWGYLGNDYMYGGNGVDRLSGYTGNDTMYGGTGLDYFIMNYDVQAASFDNIGDFTDGVDFLQLPTYAQGYTTVTSTGASTCTVSIALGGSTYNVYVSGISAAAIADQIYYFGV
jgi:Ca2+-binding RTX toxin-like protein